MKGKSSVLVGKNTVIWSTYRKSQEGIASSTGKNSFHHCRVFFFDNDYIDSMIYDSQKKRVRKKQLAKRKKKKGRVQTKKKRNSRGKFKQRKA